MLLFGEAVISALINCQPFAWQSFSKAVGISYRYCSIFIPMDSQNCCCLRVDSAADLRHVDCHALLKILQLVGSDGEPDVDMQDLSYYKLL